VFSINRIQHRNIFAGVHTVPRNIRQLSIIVLFILLFGNLNIKNIFGDETDTYGVRKKNIMWSSGHYKLDLAELFKTSPNSTNKNNVPVVD